MKKFIFVLLVLGVSSLFGEMVEKVEQHDSDEIEILVNDFLSTEKKVQVSYKEVQKQNFQSEKFFVQVFVYSEREPAELIQQIRQKGYDVSTKEAWRDGKRVNLVLVGPYLSRLEVVDNLFDLRAVSKGAFVYVSK